MTIAQADDPTPPKPLRLWPGVVAAVLFVVIRFVVPSVVPEATFFGVDALIVGMLGGVVAALAVILWWLFLSRAPWSERAGALALMIVAIIATRPILHESMAGAGMGMMFYFYAIQSMSLAFVAWAVASRRLSAGPRRASMAATILLPCGAWALVRTGGIIGEGASDLHWRWTPTPEERLLAREGLLDPAPTPAPASAPTPEKRLEPAMPSPAPTAAKTSDKAIPDESGDDPKSAAKAEAEWPGFRGPNRDGIIRGVQINTDWTASPPVELWRRPIGPGWSSFAVDGDLLYTQEQRGDDEIVAAYKVSTGEPVWRHRDPVRFYESNGGAGPRATPTVRNCRVYTFGATGIVNALDGSSGAVLWSRNAATDTGIPVPDWGFASSPLVIGDVVIVAVSGQLVAYGARTGDRRWLGPAGGAGYSSPHLATIAGIPQILLLRGSRTISVAPADGTLLWEHTWQPGVGIVQPALATDSDVLITGGDAMGGMGMRRVAVAHGPDGWAVEERWTSRGLKPYFNDFVVHKGHAFGFDGSILASIDLSDGTRKWKGERYGHGQMVLLPDQDVLLVLSEEGEVALVRATTDQFRELARFRALEGKTWNHPALVGDLLLVRNGEEMAAFRLPLAGR